MRRRISVLPYGPPAAPDVDHASYRALRGDVSFRSDPLASRNRTLGHKRTLAPGAGLIATALAAIASWVIFSAINGFATSGMPGSTPSEMILVLVQLLSFYKRYRSATSAVVPLGLVLSLIAVYIILFTGWKGRGMVFRAALSLRRGAAIGPRAPSPLHQDVAARTGFRQLDTWEKHPCQPRTSDSLSRPVQRCCAASTSSPLR